MPLPIVILGLCAEDPLARMGLAGEARMEGELPGGWTQKERSRGVARAWGMRPEGSSALKAEDDDAEGFAIHRQIELLEHLTDARGLASEGKMPVIFKRYQTLASSSAFSAEDPLVRMGLAGETRMEGEASTQISMS